MRRREFLALDVMSAFGPFADLPGTRTNVCSREQSRSDTRRRRLPVLTLTGHLATSAK
jgi:hypothetical protein